MTEVVVFALIVLLAPVVAATRLEVFVCAALETFAVVLVVDRGARGTLRADSGEFVSPALIAVFLLTDALIPFLAEIDPLAENIPSWLDACASLMAEEKALASILNLEGVEGTSSAANMLGEPPIA